MAQQQSSSPRPYRRDAIPVGPFESEPFELMSIVLGTPEEPMPSGEQVTARSGAWLSGALDFADVNLGEYDRTAVRLLAEDGWATVQIVAGWIVRAHRSGFDMSTDTQAE